MDWGRSDWNKDWEDVGRMHDIGATLEVVTGRQLFEISSGESILSSLSRSASSAGGQYGIEVVVMVA